MLRGKYPNSEIRRPERRVGCYDTSWQGITSPKQLLSPHLSLHERTNGEDSVIHRDEGMERGQKSKADRLPPRPGEAWLEPARGARAEVPKCQQAPVASAPTSNAATRQTQTTSPPRPSRHRQGRRPRARPGRARPAISSPVIRSPLAAAALGPAWTRSFSLPPRRVPRGRLGRRPRGEPEGAATAGPGARERSSPPVSHLGVEKGHAARFGLVLIRAVRHLGVKSLLPLHAGRKRFSLAGLGRGAGRARGRARAPTRATRPPPPPPPLPPPTSKPPGRPRSPSRRRGRGSRRACAVRAREGVCARSAALRRGQRTALGVGAADRGRVPLAGRCFSDPVTRERRLDGEEDRAPELRSARPGTLLGTIGGPRA